MIYGEHYVVYGEGHCPRCHRHHAVIRETHQSRLRLMELLAGLVLETNLQPPRQFGLVRPRPLHDVQEDRMFGILLAAGRTYVAQSGNTNNGHTPFLEAARAKWYVICPERGANIPPLWDINFRDIPQRMTPISDEITRRATAPRLVWYRKQSHIASGQGRE
jgi:hypothetical protein